MTISRTDPFIAAISTSGLEYAIMPITRLTNRAPMYAPIIMPTAKVPISKPMNVNFFIVRSET